MDEGFWEVSFSLTIVIQCLAISPHAEYVMDHFQTLQQQGAIIIFSRIMCLPISAHGLWEWLMILTLFAQLAYVDVLHWIVGLYYLGFLVNEGICLILVIQTFYPSTLSVLYNKDVYPTSSIVWSTTFPFYILKPY